MRVIGHRCCAARGPENTLVALDRATPHVDSVEVDVRRCGSGELVVVHDALLDRLCGLSKQVSETPWRELRTYSVLDSDAHIPRLSDVVEALPPKTGLNVELKTRGLAADVERVVSSHPRVWVSSFDAEALAETSLPRAYLFDDDWVTGLDAALGLDCQSVHPQYELVLEAPERVAAAHDAGLAVNVWTPPPDAVAELQSVGVDGVIVDDWDV